AARFFRRIYRARDVFIDPPGPEIAITLPFGTPPSREGSRRPTNVGRRSSRGDGRGVAVARAATCSLNRRTSSRSSRSSPPNYSGALETSPGFEVGTNSTPTPSAISRGYIWRTPPDNLCRGPLARRAAVEGRDA